MEFRIADTFLDSLAQLAGQEQKAVKSLSKSTSAEQPEPVPGAWHRAAHKVEKVSG